MMRKMLIASVVFAGLGIAQQQDPVTVCGIPRICPESPEKKALRSKLESDTKTLSEFMKAYEDCVSLATKLLGDGTIGRDFVRSRCDGEVMPEAVKKKNIGLRTKAQFENVDVCTRIFQDTI